MNVRFAMSTLAFLFLVPFAARAEDGNSSETGAAEATETTAAVAQTDRDGTAVMTSTHAPINKRFALWQSEDGAAFIRPILSVAASLVGYMPEQESRPDLANRLSTMVLGRFGFAGGLMEGVTFKLELERNMGFSISRNGPVGTAVWEGTASMQARETFIRLERWGLSLAGGIVVDPASVDFVSLNSLDMFGMDPFVRTPMLMSGSSQGQGFVLRYTRWNTTLGMAYTAGNPLTTSLSFPYGGTVHPQGSLHDSPYRNMARGVPGSDIQLQTLSPSLSFDCDYVQIHTAVQLYKVDINITDAADVPLAGENYRGTVRWPVLMPFFEDDPTMQNLVVLFGTISGRRNDMVISNRDLTQTAGHSFKGMVAGGGADFNYGPFSLGGGYYQVSSKESQTSDTTQGYLNIGATYWLSFPELSVGLRYARLDQEIADENTSLVDVQTFFGTLRLSL